MKTSLNSMLALLAVAAIALTFSACSTRKNSGSSSKNSAVPPAAAQSASPTNMVVAGGAATFSVGATGSPPLTYQWLFTGTNSATATNGTLAINNVQTANSANATKVTLTVVKVDSEETAGEDGKAANAVDGNPNTFWHTQWQDSSPECPHEIIIELHPACVIKGFTYLARQDDSENGMIKDYEFYVSNDGQDFGQPVNRGSFDNSKDLKTVTFAPVKCQFIKLKALSEINGEAWTSAAEIGVVSAD